MEGSEGGFTHGVTDSVGPAIVDLQTVAKAVPGGVHILDGGEAEVGRLRCRYLTWFRRIAPGVPRLRTARSGKESMALKGDLASVDLAQVFQMLALNQKVGMLSIQSPDTWKALYFDHRGVTLYYNEHLLLDRVLANMVRTGQLHTETVREARDHAGNTGQTVVDSLLASGFVSEEDLEGGFQREMEEEIYDLFFWKDARFEFFEGAAAFEGRDGVVNESFFFTTDSLIMEAARRIDEWAFIQDRVPGPEEIYRSAHDGSNIMELDDTSLSVLELTDGKRNVQRLIEVTGVPPFHVYKSLAVLLDKGQVEQVPAQDMIYAAKESVAEGRLQDAINLYERAITLEEGLPDTHALVAEAYEATEEYELAGYHLKCIAEYHAEAGNTAQTISLLRHAIELLPTDLGARERLVELTVGSHEFKTDDFDPVVEGKILVELYLEIGEVDRVRGILEKLLRDNPEDLELKKSLINVHNKAGDTKRVVELYESIAQDLVNKSEPIEAVKYLQKVLMIDRSRKDISERIRSLYELDERRRSRRRTMAALGAIFCVLVALGAVWYFYEQHARKHFDRLDVTQLIDAKDFAAAGTVFKSFIQSYPLTLVAKDAEAELASVESKRLAYEAFLDGERRNEETRKKSKRGEYRREWDRYQAEFRAQNLAAALDSIEKVKRMVEELGDESDRAWAAQVQLEKNVTDLRMYIGKAAALARSARELLAAKEWRQAREKILDLTERFEITDVAKQARIPVLLVSRPSGATVHQNGRPLTSTVNDTVQPVTTPAVVFCRQVKAERFELIREGFETRKIQIDPRAEAESHHVLTVIPSAQIEFGTPVSSPVGAAGGHLVAGLSGGKLGIARIEGGAAVGSIELGGLRELVGAPVVTEDRVIFRSNERQLLCYMLPSGSLKFSVPLPDQLIHDPVVRDGRILITDDKGRITCLDVSKGGQLWSKTVPGHVAGAPSLHRRHVRVGTPAGDYFILDVINGDVVRFYSGLPGVATSIWPTDGGAVYGTTDGRVVAVDESKGKVAWAVQVGGVIGKEQLCVAGTAALVIGEGGTLIKIDLEKGRKERTLKLPGRYVAGPVSAGRRIYLTVRESLEKKDNRDLLLALDLDELEVAWEFRDGGQFRGPVTTDGSAAYLPSSNAKVLRFQ